MECRKKYTNGLLDQCLVGIFLSLISNCNSIVPLRSNLHRFEISQIPRRFADFVREMI